MVSEGLIKELAALVPLREQEPMDKHVSFRAGGAARAFVTVPDEEMLCRVLKLLEADGADWFLLGRGSNLLVGDGGFDGVVIRPGEGFEELSVQGESLHAGAAVSLNRLASLAAEQSLSGLEFAAGIPGSVGGAVAMNAGAFDGEIRDVIRSGRILFPGEGILELSKEELDLSYRHSILKEKRGILLDALFDLHFWEKEAILDRMKSIQDARKEKQPLEYPSAGSTFKRPEGYYAGKLISDAGCKGLREGAACVSEKHAGFIVNLGGASASEIYRLMRKVQERVLQHSGVMLEPEVILLGEFDENA